MQSKTRSGADHRRIDKRQTGRRGCDQLIIIQCFGPCGKRYTANKCQILSIQIPCIDFQISQAVQIRSSVRLISLIQPESQGKVAAAFISNLNGNRNQIVCLCVSFFGFDELPLKINPAILYILLCIFHPFTLQQ